jgi:hypothetical protein
MEEEQTIQCQTETRLNDKTQFILKSGLKWVLVFENGKRNLASFHDFANPIV